MQSVPNCIALQNREKNRVKEREKERMRPADNSTAAAAVEVGFRHWNSPLPYLFGSLAIVLGLITLALLMLACSYKKSASNASPAEGAQDGAASAKQVEWRQQLEMVPKIVVIMAGDAKPTYLANPVSMASHDQQV